MGIFTDLNGRLGRNDWPPTQEIADRWEWVNYWAGLRESRDEYVRNEAFKRGLGGSSKSAYASLPVPYALSHASSNLLFGEAPMIKAGAPEDQARLEQIVRENRLLAQLRAAAVTTSSEGGVYVKVTVDPSTARGRRSPLVQFIPESRVIPQFEAFNSLRAASVVTAWEEGRKVHRLIEHHEVGLITYEKFIGSATELGVKQPQVTTKNGLEIEEMVETGIDELLVGYIPNALKTDSPFGVSDYANGIDTLFLMFNDAVGIAHRATQSGVPLTVVPRDLLDENQNLNHERTVISVNKLADTLGEGDISKMVQVIQTQAHQDKFMNYANEVLDMLLIFSGISPQSVGRNIQGGAVSGTALKLKMASTLSTAAGKAAFFEDTLSEMLRIAAILDTETIGTKPGFEWTDAQAPISVKLKDGLPDDEKETAQIVQILKNAGVMSLREAVTRANPNATDEQIDAEIEAVREDTATETAAIGAVIGPATPAATLVGDLNAGLDPVEQ
jgi:hypothetical protein